MKSTATFSKRFSSTSLADRLRHHSYRPMLWRMFMWSCVGSAAINLLWVRMETREQERKMKLEKSMLINELKSWLDPPPL